MGNIGSLHVFPKKWKHWAYYADANRSWLTLGWPLTVPRDPGPGLHPHLKRFLRIWMLWRGSLEQVDISTMNSAGSLKTVRPISNRDQNDNPVETRIRFRSSVCTTVSPRVSGVPLECLLLVISGLQRTHTDDRDGRKPKISHVESQYSQSQPQSK